MSKDTIWRAVLILLGVVALFLAAQLIQFGDYGTAAIAIFVAVLDFVMGIFIKETP